MSGSTNDRKLEHLRIIDADRDVDRRMGYFDDVRLTHRALPEIALADVDTRVTLLGRELAFPLLISSMTGGDHQVVRTINHNLAAAAEHCRVAMGVGSQRVMFDTPAATDSFTLRERAPHALLFANLGAVQLNCGYGVEACQRAVDTVGADALYLHLNPLQEAVQPEGDTDFSGLAQKIGDVAAALTVPVVLKEVGAGLSLADVELARGRGIRHFDVAGSGGTSWSRIEHHRQREVADEDELGLVFQDWGIPTTVALRELAVLGDSITLIASGGIRNGLDMAKAVVLGARLCGMASPFLRPAMDSPEAVIAVIERLRREFTTAMFLLGAASVDDILGRSDLFIHS
jgi:isopentenyl-diphosphate delta-isomerase